MTDGSSQDGTQDTVFDPFYIEGLIAGHLLEHNGKGTQELLETLRGLNPK